MSIEGLKDTIKKQYETIEFLRAELKAEREKDGTNVLIFHRQPDGRSIYGRPETFHVTTAIDMVEVDRSGDDGEWMIEELAHRIAETIRSEISLRRRKRSTA
jgi:hypothetical protein